MIEQITISDKIKKIMDFHNWNQTEFSNHFKISKSQVTRWLGGSQKPSGEIYSKIEKEYERIGA